MFKLSKFEKIFWVTILLFLISYIGLYIIAYERNQRLIDDNTSQTSTIIKEILKEDYQKVVKYTTIIKEVEDKSIKEALENNQTLRKLAYDLQNQQESLNALIDTYINHAFGSVYQNVDNFLDFHYSVIGEYSQLGAMATGKIEQSIQKRLFPSEFETQLKGLNRVLTREFKLHTQKHLDFVKATLTRNVDMQLNAKILNKLHEDIEHHIATQQLKIGTVLSIGIAAMVAKVVASKVALKATTKVAIKSSSKLAAKGATTGAAAATGALCGPAVVICSPVLATVAWFGSDALLVGADEYLNRDTFRKEIIATLEEQKEILRQDYKTMYAKSLQKLSRQIQQEYAKQPLKKKIKVKIIDKIEK